MPARDEELLVTRRFRVVRHTRATASGQLVTRESVQHPGAVAILPLLDGPRVCLIRNERVAVGRTLIEAPAGTLEPGEPPEETAARELIEETGYHAGKLRKLHEFFMSPGILNERMHLYLATDLTLGQTAREPGEEIENLIVDWDEALRMIDRGEIQDAKTIVALLYYERIRRLEA